MRLTNDYAAAFIIATHFDDFDEKEPSGTSNELNHQEEMANRERNANDSDLLGVTHHFDTSGISSLPSFADSPFRQEND
jgi:hypothetical protein